MDRRTFTASVASGAIMASLAAFAQQQGKVWRIGMLETVSTTLNAANLDAFRQGLRELAYVEGHNLTNWICFQFRTRVHSIANRMICLIESSWTSTFFRRS
jgi:hypothetical protein